MKKLKLNPKKTTSTLYIRGVTTDSKTRFCKEAKKLGYKPKELFEIIVKSL